MWRFWLHGRAIPLLSHDQKHIYLIRQHWQGKRIYIPFLFYPCESVPRNTDDPSEETSSAQKRTEKHIGMKKKPLEKQNYKLEIHLTPGMLAHKDILNAELLFSCDGNCRAKEFGFLPTAGCISISKTIL